MNKWALITGSSSGIGKSFSNLLASEGYNLITVARDSIQLDREAIDLQSRFGIQVMVRSVDLSKPDEIANLTRFIQQANLDIQVLVNNAGFGINSSFMGSDVSDESSLVNCMIMAPLELTHAVGKQMRVTSSGYIINVSSVAGFMAGSTYCSAKSWLNVFSESLHKEFRDYGINVHVICPGFTRTDFHNRCRQDVSGVPSYFWLEADEVANTAWKDVKRGKAMSIPKIQYKLLVALHQFAPRFIVRTYGRIAKAFLQRKV